MGKGRIGEEGYKGEEGCKIRMLLWRKEWDARARGIRENESEGKEAVCGRVWV
jgi:hypothetical protein